MSHVNAQRAAQIVRDAGGRVVGRTRLQKIAYLLSTTGLDEGFPFRYKHYGPYSEELAVAARQARLLGDVQEIEQIAGWGGTYSTYTVALAPDPAAPQSRIRVAEIAAQADAIELELAATAVFLAREGFDDPWAETARRKPEKLGYDRLEKAKALYRRLSAIEVPVGWPAMP